MPAETIPCCQWKMKTAPRTRVPTELLKSQSFHCLLETNAYRASFTQCMRIIHKGKGVRMLGSEAGCYTADPRRWGSMAVGGATLLPQLWVSWDPALFPRAVLLTSESSKDDSTPLCAVLYNVQKASTNIQTVKGSTLIKCWLFLFWKDC